MKFRPKYVQKKLAWINSLEWKRNIAHFHAHEIKGMQMICSIWQQYRKEPTPPASCDGQLRIKDIGI